MVEMTWQGATVLDAIDRNKVDAAIESGAWRISAGGL